MERYRNSTSVMETENHLKNGERPKVKTNRIFYLIILIAFVLLTTQNVFSQNSYYYGFGWKFQTVLVDGEKTNRLIVRNVQEHLPAQKAGLRAGDVIMAIDGQLINEETDIISRSKVTLSVKRLGNQNITIEISGVPCLSKNRMAESVYAEQDIIGHIDYYATQKTLDIEPINVMSDPDTDFFQYKSFDFEFAGQNIMQQKEIAPIIEDFLTYTGLMRNKENPDILIFIDFYSDRREQYVPPTQELTTRYGTTYNLLTKRYENQQYIESRQRGNYIDVNYLSKLSISMADARKLSKGEMEKARIWQADYEVLFGKKADHKEFAKLIGFEMLVAFPFKTQKITLYTYYYTGIVYDAEIAGRVSGVVPDSPAEKAGIKAGDIVKSCSWGNNKIFRKSFVELYGSIKGLAIYHFNSKDFALTRASNSRYWDSKYSSPFQSTYMSYFKKRKKEFTFDEISHGSEPLIFTIKNTNMATNLDGATKKVTVNPIITREKIFLLDN